MWCVEGVECGVCVGGMGVCGGYVGGCGVEDEKEGVENGIK